jgi:hypothetical protein
MLKTPLPFLLDGYTTGPSPRQGRKLLCRSGCNWDLHEAGPTISELLDDYKGILTWYILG